MKRFLMIVVALVLSAAIYAQRVDVVETTGVFGKASYPSMATKVMFSDAKTVIKEFTNMMKGYNPETLTAKKNLITIDNVIIPALSENPIDVFANISQSKGSTDVNVVVAFSLGANAFITSSQAPALYPTASNMLKVFANDLTAKNRDAILSKLGKEMSKEEKKLASYEKKAAGYQKSLDSYNKNLDKAQQKNREATTNIEDTKVKIETSNNLIKEYSASINPDNSDSAVKDALKSREKEQKKLDSYQKSLGGYQKTVESSAKDIEKNMKGKTKAENSLSGANKNVEKQREIVRAKREAYKAVENQ
ncbi:MAG: hypothetical protein II935_09055 [Bacteroidales bacterium]|nr:hypothetical protein [Bacteroidales bacterium]MBQ4476325.1 hypothetical protein [Bacteroidales bacterium]